MRAEFWIILFLSSTLNKLIYLKDLIPVNMFWESVILSRLKLDISSNINALQLLNISSILVKDEVSKYDKSSDTKDLHSENI